MYCDNINQVRRFIKAVALPYQPDQGDGNSEVIAVVQDISSVYAIDYYILDYDTVTDTSTALVCVDLPGSYLDLSIIPLFSLKNTEFFIVEHSLAIGKSWNTVRLELLEEGKGFLCD